MNLDQIDDSTLNRSLVDLDPIKNRTFNYTGNENIEAIRLTEVCAKLHGGALRMSVRSHDLSRTVQSYGLSAESTEYISAKLCFLIRRESKKSKAMSVVIKPPENSKHYNVCQQYRPDQPCTCYDNGCSKHSKVALKKTAYRNTQHTPCPDRKHAPTI